MGTLRAIQPIRHGVLLDLLGRCVWVGVPDAGRSTVKRDSMAMEPREEGNSAKRDGGDIAGEGIW